MKLILAAYLLALNLFDLYSTWRVLSRGGRETNPFLLKLQALILALPFGGKWLWLVIAKTWVAAIVLAGLAAGAWDGSGVWLLVALCAWYTYVMYRNYKAMK